MPADVKSVFLAAADKPAGDRAAYLDEACAGDDALRQRVEALLHAHDEAGDGPGTGDYASPAAPTFEAGSVFAGRYKLRELLGEGGMGTVYVADQTEPVQRRVALKVIRTGPDSARLLARFEQERQALALMDHPNIAKVFDAGIAGERGESSPRFDRGVDTPRSPGGTPYFAMELIKGVPITRYCDEAKLSPRQRLELFIPVCQAVQHAHQKGIIHRDLKPSNVLIGLYDGKPVPKVIDFGVAKATGPRLTENSVYTEVGSLVGTLEYMAPEQAELNNLDIDTRADVYALGVLLYELLTGSVPFSRHALQAAGFAEMLRVIKEVEPPKPSTRLSGSGSLPAVATSRGLDPRALERQLRGELDWIAMKCLEKERSRRYETANGLAADVQRYLADEPVTAGPPSAVYRVRKFVRRNRAAVGAAAVVVTSLVAGVAGATWGMLQAEAARRDEAGQRATAVRERDEKEVARAAEAGERLRAETSERRATRDRERAEHEANVAKAVREFLTHDLLQQANPTYQSSSLERLDGPFAIRANPTIRELLDRAADALTPGRIEQKFPGQPIVQAEILFTLGFTYRNIGEAEKAVEHLERAAALFRDGVGTTDRTVVAMQQLGHGLLEVGRLPEAVRLFESLTATMTPTFGSDDPIVLDLHVVLNHARTAAGQRDALPGLEAAVARYAAVPGKDRVGECDALNRLAGAYVRFRRYGDAVKTLEKAVAITKQFRPPNHPHLLQLQKNLANAHVEIGRTREAAQALERIVPQMEAQYGRDNPRTLNALQGLAQAYCDHDALAAIRVIEDMRARKPDRYDPNGQPGRQVFLTLGEAYRRVGRLAEAIGVLERVRDAELQDRDGAVSARTLNLLSNAYYDAGRLTDAIAALERRRAMPDEPGAADEKERLASASNLARAYRDAGRLPEAFRLFEEIMPLSRTLHGPNEPITLGITRNWVGALEKDGQLGRAVAERKALLALERQVYPPGHPQLASNLELYGQTLLTAGKPADAEPLLRESLAIGERSQPDSWRTWHTRSLLGGSLLGQKKYADAEPLLTRGFEGLKQRRDAIPAAVRRQRLGDALTRLIELADATGKPDEAVKWRAERDAAAAAK